MGFAVAGHFVEQAMELGFLVIREPIALGFLRLRAYEAGG
jgi:hypothetical protein